MENGERDRRRGGGVGGKGRGRDRVGHVGRKEGDKRERERG